MGCYDTVFGKCPTCFAVMSYQSKAGSCDLIDYEEDAVPIEIAMALEGETKYCSICGKRIKVVVSPLAPRSVAVKFVEVE